MKTMLKGLTVLLCVALLLLCASCGQPPLPEREPVPHEHILVDGTYGLFGVECEHRWRDGVCTLCGMACAHEWQDSVCRVCGTVCSHEWQDGVCCVCGKVCAHEWKDGVCTLCGYACPHALHGEEDCICLDCGLPAPHDYCNGICTRCGSRAVYITRLKDFPVELKNDASAKGTVEWYHFPVKEGEIVPGAHGTALPSELKAQDMAVYTPFGYDPARRYNVVIITPVATHNAHTWVDRANLLNSVIGRIKGFDLVDRVIEKGMIEPTIFAVVEYYPNGHPNEVAPDYSKDLRERVLPFLAANYSTYACFDEDGHFVPAPEHFGFVGASFSSMLGWHMLPDNTDLFSYWGLIGGGFDVTEMAKRINAGVSAEHPIHWIFTGEGTASQGCVQYQRRVEELAENCACLEMGKNLCFIAVEKAGHNYSSWDIGLIDCMQNFFCSRYVPLRKVPNSSMELLTS